MLLTGYVVLSAVLLGVGLLLTHTLAGSVGRWDEHANEFFANHRTTGWNDITKVATSAFNTLPVIILAAIVTAVLVLRHRRREAVFLVLALVVEITVFLSVTFIVARPRPDVPRLNATPATSSFPSGHTAAATVLYVGVAIIVVCCTQARIARVAMAALALAVVTLVGFARVYRGLHHPTDVFAGVLFGLACLFVSALAVRTVPRTGSADARAGLLHARRSDAGVDRETRDESDRHAVGEEIHALALQRDPDQLHDDILDRTGKAN